MVFGATRRLNDRYDKKGGTLGLVHLDDLRFMADGRRIFFWSPINDLVAPDDLPAHPTDFYFYDCIDGTINPLDLDELSPIRYNRYLQRLTITPDGRYIAFQGMGPGGAAVCGAELPVRYVGASAYARHSR